MEGGEWELRLSSLWVVASRGGVAGNEGARVVTDYEVTVQAITETGPPIMLFTEAEHAERYVRDGGLEDYEPATFLDLKDVALFLVHVTRSDVVGFVLDPIYGHQNVRLMSVANFVHGVARALEKARGCQDQGSD